MKRLCAVVLTLATTLTVGCRGYDVKIFNQSIIAEEPVRSQIYEQPLVGYDPNLREDEAVDPLRYSVEGGFRSTTMEAPVNLNRAFKPAFTVRASYKVNLDEKVSLATH